MEGKEGGMATKERKKIGTEGSCREERREQKRKDGKGRMREKEGREGKGVEEKRRRSSSALISPFGFETASGG